MPDEELAGGRREEILREAEKLFAERGYRETGLYEVAERLGFNRQAIYHYFKSKDDILLELVGRAGYALQDSAEPTFRSELPPKDKLAELVRNHIRQVLRHPAVFRIQFQELGKIADPRGKEMQRDQAAYVRRVASVIRQGQSDGVFNDTPHTTMALFIIGMCNWITEWYGKGTGLSIDEVADHGARLAVQGAQSSASGRAPAKKTATPSSSSPRKRPANNSGNTKGRAATKRPTKATASKAAKASAPGKRAANSSTATNRATKATASKAAKATVKARGTTAHAKTERLAGKKATKRTRSL